MFKKMAAGNPLVHVPAELVRKGFLSGLFSAPQDLETDRLSLDARPPNTLEPVLTSWTSTMSSASALSSMELADDESLFMSGRNIRDFFYQFKIGPQRALRSVLACAWSAGDLEFILVPSLTRAAMWR